MKSLPAFLALLTGSLFLQAEPVLVPAFTAYTEPNPEGARLSESSGLTGWRSNTNKVLWFGDFKNSGTLDVSLQMRLPTNQISRLRLSVAGHSKEIEIQGAGTNLVVASFGNFPINQVGFHSLTLESLKTAPPFGDIWKLVLDGDASQGAHFNLKPRRNAASVHLKYPIPNQTNVAAFYCEATGIEDPLWTYSMACGWQRGYFGMQVNSPTERRIIFSVWDSGNEAVSRGKVEDENRVTLIAKGDGVSTGDFGNEGTGGHSHLVYPWKTGELQRFLVTAQPTNETFTIYSGYWFHPEKKAWMLISSWRAPKDGAWLHGLYSFSENFVGSNGQLRRKALFGNQWIKTDSGSWLELTTAAFSHDATGKEDRLDRFMGVENGQFFLSQGGYIEGSTKSGEIFVRPATGGAPAIELPSIHAHKF